jgi:transposase
VFRSGRDFAAWIGLVPRQDSTGGKQKLGPISKQGDRYLRRILIVGAIAVLRRAQENPGKYRWLTQLLARRAFKVVAVALANKMARVSAGLGLMIRAGYDVSGAEILCRCRTSAAGKGEKAHDISRCTKFL